MIPNLSIQGYVSYSIGKETLGWSDLLLLSIHLEEMTIPRIAQLVGGVGVFLVLSIFLLHTSSDISIPFPESWRTRPLYIAPTVSDSDNRHLTSAQCKERYPGLYYEADQARAYHQKHGGISESAVDSADQDEGASARLAIINNKVSIDAS
jgi:hypothetical protein